MLTLLPVEPVAPAIGAIFPVTDEMIAEIEREQASFSAEICGLCDAWAFGLFDRI